MKKKIFVLFLTVCFLSTPLSAKATMFDAMPKANDNHSIQMAEGLELQGEEANGIFGWTYADDVDSSEELAERIRQLAADNVERGSLLDDLLELLATLVQQLSGFLRIFQVLYNIIYNIIVLTGLIN